MELVQGRAGSTCWLPEAPKAASWVNTPSHYRDKSCPLTSPPLYRRWPFLPPYSAPLSLACVFLQAKGWSGLISCPSCIKAALQAQRLLHSHCQRAAVPFLLWLSHPTHSVTVSVSHSPCWETSPCCLDPIKSKERRVLEGGGSGRKPT